MVGKWPGKRFISSTVAIFFRTFIITIIVVSYTIAVVVAVVWFASVGVRMGDISSSLVFLRHLLPTIFLVSSSPLPSSVVVLAVVVIVTIGEGFAWW